MLFRSIVSTAVSKTLPQHIAGDAGENGKVNGIHHYQRRIGWRLRDSVRAGEKLVQVGDLPGLHNAGSGAQRHTERFPGR